MQDAIGAINGTHIPALIPITEQMAYINRHGIQSQIILIVCNYDMRFTYVYAGWNGSTNDTRVLEITLRMDTDFPIPPPGSIHEYYFKYLTSTCAYFCILKSIELKRSSYFL